MQCGRLSLTLKVYAMSRENVWNFNLSDYSNFVVVRQTFSNFITLRHGKFPSTNIVLCSCFILNCCVSRRQYDCSRKHYLSELENRGQDLCKEHGRIIHQIEHITWHIEGCTRHRPCGASKKQTSSSSNVSCMSNSAPTCNRPSALVSRKLTINSWNFIEIIPIIQLIFILFSHPNKGSFLPGKFEEHVWTFHQEHCGFKKENLLSTGKVGMWNEGKNWSR